MTDDLDFLLRRYRHSRKVLNSMREAVRKLGDVFDSAQEEAADREADLANHLREHGPLTKDGRRYRAVERDGIWSVDVEAVGPTISQKPLSERGVRQWA